MIIIVGCELKMGFNKPVNVKQRSQLTLANVSVALQRRHDYVCAQFIFLQPDDPVAGVVDYSTEAMLSVQESSGEWIN